jgi:CRISPR-associated endoribonuclease Cas6
MSQVQLQKFSYTPLGENFTLRFLTPLRIKSQNEFLKTTPSLTQLLYSIRNRYAELNAQGRTKLGYEPSFHQRFGRTSFLDLTRYSSRQESKLGIGGIMGEIGYSGVDEESRQLLRLGELIGVGKQTVFGMGKILVEESK